MSQSNSIPSAMKIAFYAPMKAPTEGTPSGDRTIGRLLIAALEHAGFDVRVASNLRTWSSVPDPKKLDALAKQSNAKAAELNVQYGHSDTNWRPDLWLTYHSYFKAPDLLGPKVSDALRIPYAIVEASYSARREQTAWADWLAAARTSLIRADAIFSFTARDRVGLAGLCAPMVLHDLAPFLDLTDFGAPPTKRSAAPARLATVAMMRPGAKAESYQLLAAALETVKSDGWHLDIVGDGTARADVEAAFSPLPATNVTFHGALAPDAVRHLLQRSDVFVWPGLDEAFGMAYLEAQACGLPVAALHTAGVPEVVRHQQTGLLASSRSPEDYARVISTLIEDPDMRHMLGRGARQAIERHHSLTAASATLASVLGRLIARA